MSAFKEEENEIVMPDAFGLTGTNKSRRERSDFVDSKLSDGQKKKNWDGDNDDDSIKLQDKPKINKLVEGDDDDIPIIPDLEQVQEEEMAITVAQPPQLQLNNIQTIAEIEADLADTMGVGGLITTYGGIDMSLLAKEALVPLSIIEEKDEIWEWDSLFASLKSDLKKNIS